MTTAVEKGQAIERILAVQEKLLLVLGPLLPKEWFSLDLTMPQLKIMFHLWASGPTRMGALASALEVSLPTTTGIVGRLVERGLIVRDSDPNDRRAIICRLSDSGRELMGHLGGMSLAQSRKMLERVTTGKLLRIGRAMETILEIASGTDSSGEGLGIGYADESAAEEEPTLARKAR